MTQTHWLVAGEKLMTSLGITFLLAGAPSHFWTPHSMDKNFTPKYNIHTAWTNILHPNTTFTLTLKNERPLSFLNATQHGQQFYTQIQHSNWPWRERVPSSKHCNINSFPTPQKGFYFQIESFFSGVSVHQWIALQCWSSPSEYSDKMP